jgi:hypothetical protein
MTDKFINQSQLEGAAAVACSALFGSFSLAQFLTDYVHNFL